MLTHETELTNLYEPQTNKDYMKLAWVPLHSYHKVHHCKEELRKSWEAMEQSYRKMDPSQVPRKGVSKVANGV